MKKIMFIGAVFLSLCGAAQNTMKFSVKGSFSNISMPVEKIYLSYRDDQKNITDSTVPQDGKYNFEGAVTEPVLASLRIKYKAGDDGKPVRLVRARDLTTLFLSEGMVTVTSVDSFGNAKVSGTKAQEEYSKIAALEKPYNDRFKELNEAYSKASAAKDDAQKEAIEHKMDDVDKEMRDHVYGVYLKNNPSSPIVMYAMNTYAGYDINVDETEPLFELLDARTKAYPSARFLASRIDIAKKTAVGKDAIDFVQNDTLGNPVKLSSLKGKYLLVDFWASWCGPCRAENPNVVKAFQKYKDKGFSIIGVSLDQPGARQKWMDAIHADGLYWTQVSDLKFWDNEVAKTYGIQAIPQNLLLDPKGKIIAKNVTGDALVKKLAEVMP